jgi:hypothetical protein
MPKDCLPPHLRDTRHWDWWGPFKYIPRGWTAWCWGKPTFLWGNQTREKDGYPLPIGEPGSYQVSFFPQAPFWAFWGLYVAFTLKGGRHWRFGTRWDDVDLYCVFPTLATRWFPPDGERDTSTKETSMGILTPVKVWLFTVALKKGIKAIVTVALSWLTSIKVAPILASMGVTIDPAQLEMWLTGALTGLLTIIFNFLKVKTKLGAKLF